MRFVLCIQYPLRTNFTFTRIKRSQLIKQKTVALQLYNIYLPDDSPLYHEEGTRAPGSFIEDPKTGALHVMCADGLVIGVVHLKAEGKKTIRGKDFVNGYEIRKSGGIFNVEPDIDSIKPGQSGVRLTKRREEYGKVIRKRLGMRREVYDKIYKQDS
jgi:methionyl-tRNA formyltransferase